MPAVLWADMERLGSLRLASAAVTTGVLTIPAREQLLILFSIAGFNTADIPALRFNADSGTTYNDRHITWLVNTVTPTNARNISTNLLRLSGVSSVGPRMITASVMNILAVAKPVTLSISNGTGAAGTEHTEDFGSGEWVNTAAQITSVELRSAGGTNTLSAGSGFTVFGCNP